MNRLGRPVLNLQSSGGHNSPFLFGFWQEGPMKTARWWSVAFLLLGLAVLGNNGRPNKEGFGSPPYRPVMKFRHKVLIGLIFNLLSATRRHFVFAKFEVNCNRIYFDASHDSGLFVFPFCRLKRLKDKSLSLPLRQEALFPKKSDWCEACLSKENMFSWHFSWVF